MIELVPTDIAHGGEAVGRVDGKAHFVSGVIPGEHVTGEVIADRGSWARVELGEILQPSTERVDPPCAAFGECGGCQWQFANYAAQLDWKRSILVGQLNHVGRIEEPPVTDTVACGDPYAYRNRMDFRVRKGRPALHERRSRSLVPLERCHLLHRNIERVFARLGDLEGLARITLRTSATTGQVLAILYGNPPTDISAWGCDVAVRRGKTIEAVIGDNHLTETVAGVALRITGDAFFQTNTAGAEALVSIVRRTLATRPTETLLDAYAGGGLFAATVGADAERVIAVEGSRIATDDLRHNMASRDKERPGSARVINGPVESVVPGLDEPWDVAVVDPPRVGLGQSGVDAVTAASPRTIAYVSCDPASLARDARYLINAGYVLEEATPVDLFPQTFHVEAVAKFTSTPTPSD